METPPSDLSWLNQVAPDRGKTLREGSAFIAFEKGVWLFWENAGEYYIEADTGTIHQQIPPDADPLLVMLIGESTARSVSWLYRGAVVLHGGAVKFRGKTILFMGDSGAGKSTIIHNFLNQGAELIAEDDLIFPHGGCSFIAGPPLIKLWMDQGPEGASRIKPQLSKYLIRVRRTLEEEVFTPDIIYSLCWQEKEGLQFREVQAFGEKIALLHQLSKGWYMFGEDFQNRNFAIWAPFSQIPVFWICRSKDIDKDQIHSVITGHLPEFFSGQFPREPTVEP